MNNFNNDSEDYFVSLKEKVTQYCSDWLLLMKIQLAEKIALVISTLVTGYVIACVGFLVLFFISLMAAFYIGEHYHSYFIGFGVVALFYSSIFIVLIIFRKQFLNNLIINNLLKLIFQNDSNNTNK